MLSRDLKTESRFGTSVADTMFGSSAFYTKGLHPTVEEQVELARRISSSLSDVSNKTSKGQSMYVNRKKRSVKWVHEGQGKTTKRYKLSTTGDVFM